MRGWRKREAKLRAMQHQTGRIDVLSCGQNSAGENSAREGVKGALRLEWWGLI